MKKLKKIFTQTELLKVFGLFTLIEFVAIGINIPQLGFYHDDWYLLWSGAARGVNSIVVMFATDRPIMGVIYSITYSVFGDNLLLWHIYAFLLRLVGGFAFYGILRRIFPNQPGLNFFMVAVFYIYPGFLSQPDANTKQNHLLGYGIAIFSIYLSIISYQAKKLWNKLFFSFFSALLALSYFFIYEYMIGLEVARVIFLGIAIYHDRRENLKQNIINAVKIWAPISVAGLWFLYWRFFIFESTRSATNVVKLSTNYFDNFQIMGYRLVFQTARDLFDITLFAWFVKPYSLMKTADNTDLFWGLLFGFIIGIIAIRWVEKHRDLEKEPDPRLMIVAGLWIILSAILPVVLANREFDPNDAYKSYGLHPTMGVALFMGGLYSQIKKNYGRHFILIIFVIAISTQYLNGIEWANLWALQKQMWWQLSWRAPDLEAGTVLVIQMPDGRKFRENYEVWGPANLIYTPQKAETPILSAEVLTPDIFVYASREENSGAKTRDIIIRQDFDKLLVLSMPDSRGCLTVNSKYLPIYGPNTPNEVIELIPFSEENQILADEKQKKPPAHIFGQEPEHEWCYYYQKASLASQMGDWNAINELYQKVSENELEPRDQVEWIPFLIGMYQSGDIDGSINLYKEKFKRMDRFEILTCSSEAVLLENGENDPRFETLRKIVCE